VKDGVRVGCGEGVSEGRAARDAVGRGVGDGTGMGEQAALSIREMSSGMREGRRVKSGDMGAGSLYRGEG
jgi:hypothetical protein